MTKRTFPSKFQSRSLWIVMITFFYGIQVSCGPTQNNQATESNSAQKVIMALNIKFKEGSNGETRDAAVRTIQKLVTDSALKLNHGKNDGPPIIFIELLNTKDTLSVVMEGKTESAMTISGLGDTTKCTCTKNCGVCLMVNPLIGPGNPGPLEHILSISDFRVGDNISIYLR